MAATSPRQSAFRQLPDAIQMVTSTVRSGLPVNEALRAIAREMPQPNSRAVCDRMQRNGSGRPPEEAVEAVYRRTQVAEYAMFAVTLAVQLKSGGSLAETLQTLGDTVTSACCAGCSREGSGRRGDLFLACLSHVRPLL